MNAFGGTVLLTLMLKPSVVLTERVPSLPLG